MTRPAVLAPPSDSQPRLRLHAHRVWSGAWVVDIDDEADRQPDAPYWCAECQSLAEALELGCAQLSAFYHDLPAVLATGRISGTTPITPTTSTTSIRTGGTAAAALSERES